VARAVSWLVLGLSLVAGIVGCSPESRYRVLALLFEEVPRPGDEVRPVPVVRSPRRPPPPTPTPIPVEPAGTDPVEATKFTTWDDVTRLLPKDQVGNPDWGAALQEQAIAPRPGIEPDAVEADALALDVDLAPKSDPAFKVTFSHQKHGQWLACPNCHTALFEMQAGATAMAPAAVHGDRYCGACHGKVAFDIAGGCLLCHLRNLPMDASGRIDWSRAMTERLIAPRPGPKAVDAPPLDLDIEMTPPAQPTLKGVFSHATHTQWLACSNCHPSLFPTEKGTAGMHGADLHSRRACGACHGPVAFGMIGNCGRCHPVLQTARQHQETLDLDIQMTPKSALAGTTIFSHKTHRWVDCAACHSGMFDAAAAVAPVPPADIIGGKYCAVCHGKVTSDLVAQCQRCHAGGGTP